MVEVEGVNFRKEIGIREREMFDGSAERRRVKFELGEIIVDSGFIKKGFEEKEVGRIAETIDFIEIVLVISKVKGERWRFLAKQVIVIKQFIKYYFGLTNLGFMDSSKAICTPPYAS